MCTNYRNIATETQRTLLSLSWGQRKGVILEDFTEEVTFELGLEG